MVPSDVLGVAPWVIVTALVTWGAQLYLYRVKRADAKKVATAETAHNLEVHRDELTFQLLQAAKLEMTSARLEVEDLREEVRKLRSMENHFYHFQQALDHLEALLFAHTDEDRAQAERNARAFLNRMRRLSEAKGTIANEVQRVASEVELGEQAVAKKDDKNANG